MAQSYASDADLIARVPATLSVTNSLAREAALDDAKDLIDLRSYRGLSLLAHCYAAAHLLAIRFPTEMGESGGGGAGAVTSIRAGEIAATFAAPTATAATDLTTTRWGRELLTLMPLHAPEVG